VVARSAHAHILCCSRRRCTSVARVGGQHVLEPVDHRGVHRATGHRDDHRPARAGRQVGHRHVHRDELGRVLALVDAAADQRRRRPRRRHVRTCCVGLREEHHVDRGLEVLQRRDAPRVALLGDLALHRRPARDDHRSAVADVVRHERGDRAVGRGRRARARAEQRVVGHVEPEHLALELRAACSCPTPRRGSAAWPMPSSTGAPSGRRRGPAAEQVELADGLVALGVDDRVDGHLVHVDQPAPA
jgi:hypothetical protein